MPDLVCLVCSGSLDSYYRVHAYNYTRQIRGSELRSRVIGYTRAMLSSSISARLESMFPGANVALFNIRYVVRRAKLKSFVAAIHPKDTDYGEKSSKFEA